MRYLFLAYCCACSYAQDIGEFAPDRPGFTSAGGVVGLGVFQIENGYVFESARSGGARIVTVSGPQTLLRFGLTEALEIRFATGGYAWQAQRSAGFNIATEGALDSVVSAKLRLLKPGRVRPELAITAGLSSPNRTSPFTSSGRDPSFSLGANKDGHGFSVAANANVTSVTDERGRFASAAESVWVSHSAGGVSLFAEAYRTTTSRMGASTTALDAGLFRGIGKNIQVDLGAGHTLAGEHPAWFATMGFVFRVPRRLIHRE